MFNLLSSGFSSIPGGVETHESISTTWFVRNMDFPANCCSFQGEYNEGNQMF